MENRYCVPRYPSDIPKAELEINGTPAWKGEGLAGPKEGFIALQAEVPGGGQFRFRNIYLTK